MSKAVKETCNGKDDDCDGIIDEDAEIVVRLREAGAVFRNEVITGPGGRQVLVEDPSGNPIELFQPA